ncbi:MAG: MFS transporter [Gemmatimonadetes bacterium]|nr:MFS transporter [Gemmatimonadota bacterium]
MERQSAAGAAPWDELVLFFVANVLFAAGLFFHAFLYNFYLDALGLRESVMGLAAAALTAGGLASLAPAGIVVDRLGARAAYVAAAVLTALGLTAGAFVVRPLAICATAFIAGAGAAVWRVAMGPIVMELAPPALRSRAFSWNVALLVGSGAAWMATAGEVPGRLEAALGLSGVGGVRGGLVTGAVGTALGGAAFAFVRRGAGAAIIASSAAGPPVATLPARARQALAGLRIPRPLVTLVVLVAVWMTAGGLVIPFFNLYFQRVHGAAPDRIGWIFAAAQALTAAVIFGSGAAAGRVGVRCMLAAWMLLFAPALWVLAAAGALPLAIALYLLQGIVPPATNPLIDQVLLERAPRSRHGAVSSWRNGATELSGLVGAGAGGALLEAGSFDLLFAVAGAVALGGAVALILGLRRAGSAAPAGAGALDGSETSALDFARPRDRL